MTLLPSKLKAGDTIGLLAPSKAFNESKRFEIENFIDYIEGLGLYVKTSKNFFGKDKFGTSSGTPEERAYDINTMFADTSISAIWTLQGGSLANQTLDLIDFEMIKSNPKIFIGKSDIDVLLLAIYKKTGLITFHSCDSKIGSNKELDFEYTKECLHDRLFEGAKIINTSNTKEWKTLSPGKATGKSLGCNLDCILKLAGTEYFPDFANSIFFIESYKSNPGALIYQLTQLQMLGIFELTKGIVIGSNYGFISEEFKAEDIIQDFLKDYHLPILKINEFGHYQPHMFLPIGAEVELDATNKTLKIIDDFLT